MSARRWLGVAAGWLCAAACAPSAYGWEIAAFATRAELHPDATATITETITADFSGEWRHGLYRDIPVHYLDRAGQHLTMRLWIREVTDEAGRRRPFTLESAGRYERVRIGDPERTVTGRQTYRLVYEVQRGAVRFFPDHDEFYWNLTGNEWAVPIRQMRGEILPPPAAANLRAIALAGGYGSTAQWQGLRLLPGQVVLEPERPLQPYEGVTVVVGWAKGAVTPPAAGQVVRWWLQDNWVYGLPLAILIGLTWLWYARGRDPRTGRAVVTQYNPPEGLTPAEAGTLIDQRLHLRDITSTVIDLAVRGYLRLEPEHASWLSAPDYTVSILKPWREDTQLKPHEREVLSGMFGAADHVKLSDLHAAFYEHLPAIRNDVYDGLVAGGYFDGNPYRVRMRYMILGLTVGGLMCTALLASQPRHQLPWPPLVLASAASALLFVVFSGFMPRRTLKGAQATDQLMGFLEFLRRTDQDRIRRMNDPRLFERWLPFALAFNVANQWARVFDGIYTQPPGWYGGSWDHFSASGFSRALGRTTGAMGHSFTSAPSGSSGSFGDSGFGGGGFSGGGGGGGGGGAW